MPLMRAPNGETAEVPWEEVRHYMGAGASLLPPQDQAPMGGAAYSGTPDEPLQDPGFLDPANYLPSSPQAIGASAAVRGAMALPGALRSAQGGMATVRGAIGGALSGTPIIGPMIRGAVKGMRSAQAPATEAAEQAGSAAARVLRPGVPPAPAMPPNVVPGRVPTQAAGSAASRVSPEAVGEVAERAAETTPKALKEATAYWRRRTMALANEAGAPVEAEAQRKLFGEILGKEVKSRTSLTIDDWAKVSEAMNERIMQRAATEAAKKATTSAAKKAEKAIPKPRAKPKVGSAESRVKIVPKTKARRKTSGPSFEKSGSLEAQLRKSVNVGEVIGQLPLEEQAAAWQVARQLAGQ